MPCLLRAEERRRCSQTARGKSTARTLRAREGEQARKAHVNTKAHPERAETGPRTDCIQNHVGSGSKRQEDIKKTKHLNQSPIKTDYFFPLFMERRNLESLDVSMTAALHENHLMYIRR